MWYIALIVVIVIVASFFNTPKGKGIYGEWSVYRVLKRLAKQYGGIELNNFMFEDKLSSSQVDNMLLTDKALYVFEVKNYSGHIFGTETQQNWTVTIKHVNRKTSRSGKVYYKTNISKHQFYNPIKQNQTHINKIKNLTSISESIPIINIVVFGAKAFIRDVNHSEDKYVINRCDILSFVNNQEKIIQNSISTELLCDFADQLYAINITDKKRRRKHVADIKKNYAK